MRPPITSWTMGGNGRLAGLWWADRQRQLHTFEPGDKTGAAALTGLTGEYMRGAHSPA